MAASVSTVAPTDSVSAVPRVATKSRPLEPVSSPVDTPKAEPVEVDTKQDRAITMEEVQKAVETLDAAVEKYAPAMNIGFDGELNKMIVRVTDAETNEVIRELPPEEVLDIARFLERNGVDAVGSESLRGMLLDEYI